MKKRSQVVRIIFTSVRQYPALSLGILFSVAGAVVAALLPPLVLEQVVNRLTDGLPIPFTLALLYLGLIALTGVLETLRESLLTIFGQKIAKRLRHELCAKLSRLPAEAFVKQDPGVVSSRFVGDVDTVETLFTSGIISMFADACKIISIFAIIFVKNKGLSLVLALLLPAIYAFTRAVQKRMLKAQIANRAAVGRVTGHVPETIRCIRTVHTLCKEEYMQEKYDRYIQESYRAVEKTNFYDAIYSPVILVLNAAVTAAVMLLAATGNTQIQSFFGMTVGTAVAVISYISQVFSPIESIGMEIQTIQSAVAGVHRIDEFLAQPERWETDKKDVFPAEAPCVELKNVAFGYGQDGSILEHLSFRIDSGEQVVLSGRTGAGKSTIFKLLLGLYRPREGEVRICGKDAALIGDHEKRELFGYVEQTFCMVPGTVLEQITLFDARITPDAARRAAQTVGLHETITELEQGYDTPCVPGLFSQGQWQLLSIARSIAAEPQILLLDEITANLDSDTEQMVLHAIGNASKNRTVISISHRLYEKMGGRQIVIKG